MNNKTNMDPLVMLQQEICDMWGIDNLRQYVFYYDESNNCRKFWVDASKQQFNTDPLADFVLAGIVRKSEDKVDVSIDAFKHILKLQKNVKEIKFKKLFSKGDFMQCIKEKRLFELLSWIDKSPFYIHYINVNNLFYTLVEIFDSIVKPEELHEFGFDYFYMKSVFYNMFAKQTDELQNIMIKYKYPNLQHEDIAAFCSALLLLVGPKKEMNIEEKFLYGMLARATKSDELVFLHDNENYIMQENYAEFYLDIIRKYQTSIHVFDEEPEVEKEVMKQVSQYDNMEKNYSFVKSEMDIYVQLSDVIAGILGKMFKYINATTLNQLRKDINGLSELQVANILLIDKLRTEAERENKGFLCSVAPLDEISKLNSFFEMVKKR